jgi:hypothetical protein
VNFHVLVYLAVQYYSTFSSSPEFPWGQIFGQFAETPKMLRRIILTLKLHVLTQARVVRAESSIMLLLRRPVGPWNESKTKVVSRSCMKSEISIFHEFVRASLSNRFLKKLRRLASHRHNRFSHFCCSSGHELSSCEGSEVEFFHIKPP